MTARVIGAGVVVAGQIRRQGSKAFTNPSAILRVPARSPLSMLPSEAESATYPLLLPNANQK